jgi:2-methylfumaryl-CoA hydratase
VANDRVEVGGRFFEDFEVGQVFTRAPSLTVTAGHAAFHQALFGDRLRLPLDTGLSAAVTGRADPYVHPNLVCNVATGQSTDPIQRVQANLFYRGVVFSGQVFVGDTLQTRAEVVALRQTEPREDAPATGLVALQVSCQNQGGEPVLEFWRCPMIPLRDPKGDTGREDSFDDIPSDLDSDQVQAAVPREWRLDVFRDRVTGGRGHFADVVLDTSYRVEGRDTVTAAPELARLTLNVASTHTDVGASAFPRRPVSGGHTISMAGAQIVRALPNLVTVLAWPSCELVAPVFEGDILRTEVRVDGAYTIGEESGLVDLRARVFAERGGERDGGDDDAGEEQVLDWRLIGLMA